VFYGAAVLFLRGLTEFLISLIISLSNIGHHVYYTYGNQNKNCTSFIENIVHDKLYNNSVLGTIFKTVMIQQTISRETLASQFKLRNIYSKKSIEEKRERQSQEKLSRLNKQYFTSKMMRSQ
jgi:hypothetical protein